jgi:SagB-type dehydrogenase family enzyme
MGATAQRRMEPIGTAGARMGPLVAVTVLAVAAGSILIAAAELLRTPASSPGPPGWSGAAVALPSPRHDGSFSLESALRSRRSVRAFAATPLTLDEIGQLLWAAQGVTDAAGHRTAPSAGALYPLELDIVTAAGVARYVPEGHELVLRGADDVRIGLRAAALDQAAISEAPLVIVVSGVVARTAERYGPERAERYVALEAGHAAQNVLLQATALGLGTVPIGAFDDAAVRDVLGLADGEAPLYLIPIGWPAE